MWTLPNNFLFYLRKFDEVRLMLLFFFKKKIEILTFFKNYYLALTVIRTKDEQAFKKQGENKLETDLFEH